MKKIIVVVGPTAVGKTALSIEIAQLFLGEIISGDSMQVYENLPIGTNQVSLDEQQGVPHHLLNFLPWNQNYSAFDFQKAANEKIKEIEERGHLPMIVGGTGLYVQALLEGFSVTDQLATSTSQQENAWDKLQKKDPQLAATTHPNNQRRITRALDRKITTRADPGFDIFFIPLTLPRPTLYERINQRVDEMMTEGLLQEAEKLYHFQKENFQEKRTVLQAIGYKEFFPYFAGEISLTEAIELVKRNSRRYAKRQITWFKNRMDLTFYQLDEPGVKEEILNQLSQWLKQE